MSKSVNISKLRIHKQIKRVPITAYYDILVTIVVIYSLTNGYKKRDSMLIIFYNKKCLLAQWSKINKISVSNNFRKKCYELFVRIYYNCTTKYN